MFKQGGGLGSAAMSQISFRQSTKFEVSDAFYELLVYENLELIVQKYIELQQEHNQRALSKLAGNSGNDDEHLRENSTMNQSLKQ